MKEFSILNGYLVKDKKAREDIEILKDDASWMNNHLLNYETPQMWGAYGDGVHDDTQAIQTMLSTGNDVYFPDGTYLISGDGLTINKENQKIVFHGGAWIEAKNITSWHVLLIKSKYNKLYDVKIRLENPLQTIYAIQIGEEQGEGFNCYLYETTVTGTGRVGLQVNGAETRVMGGKFRGMEYGICVEAPDFYCENIYCEQCTKDGFYARSGSIEAHHIHSYNNNGKGFNLAGVNFSNFYGLYADKNVGDGVYIAENSGELNIFGGWSFYSGYQRTDKSVFDWNFSNVKDLNLWGCRSSGGDETKVASYNVKADCRIYFYGCMANLNPKIADGGIAKFMNCQDKLKRYNTSSNSYNGTRQVADAGAITKVTVYVDEILNEEKDIKVFDVLTQFRSILGYKSGMTKHLLQVSEAYEDKFMPIVEDEKITVSSPAVTFTDNGATVIEFNVMNNTEEQLQINVTLNKAGSVY
jgi:hypothetical protein